MEGENSLIIYLKTVVCVMWVLHMHGALICVFNYLLYGNDFRYKSNSKITTVKEIRKII